MEPSSTNVDAGRALLQKASADGFTIQAAEDLSDAANVVKAVG